MTNLQSLALTQVLHNLTEAEHILRKMKEVNTGDKGSPAHTLLEKIQAAYTWADALEREDYEKS